MPRFLTRPALALLGVLALLCLAACTPTARPATVECHAPLRCAPTVAPVRIPAGWKVLTRPHFRLAYPPDWTTSPSDPALEEAVHTDYIIATPAGHVRLDVSALEKTDVLAYCPVATPDTLPPQPTTLAGLPMRFQLIDSVRWWWFLNAQRTSYQLRASDYEASAAIKAQDDAILGTFRPDNVTPWQC